MEIPSRSFLFFFSTFPYRLDGYKFRLISWQQTVKGKTIYSLQNFLFKEFQHDLDHEVDDLHGADEGEAREEPHGASYTGQLVYKLGCLVLKYISSVTKLNKILCSFLILSKVEERTEIWTNFSLLLNFRSAVES